MHSVVKVSIALALGLCAGSAIAQEGVWRPTGSQAASSASTVSPSAVAPSAVSAPARAPLITLGRPVPLNEPALVQTNYAPSNTAAPAPAPAIDLGTARPAVVRAQAGELPPTPPPPPASPFATAAPGAEEAYNCGVTAPKKPGFFTRAWDGCREWFQGVPKSMEGAFQPGPGGRGGIFQSDHRYDEWLVSPTTNPFYFEDPRALTEVRPIFMWQQTPGSNYIFRGGDNVFAGAQARLAITPWFSVVVHELGMIWMEPHNQIGEFAPHTGFAEFHIGPKVTFLHLDNFVMAAGLIFEIPTGPAKVFQDTGTLSIDPYFSLAWHPCIGGFNGLSFMNTTGYSFSIDDQRGEFLWSSFNLSYDVAGLHRVYPFIEFNFKQYTINGHTRDIGFEGSDLFHFGSQGAAGHQELTMALGTRVKVNDFMQFGIGAEFSIIGGGRHLDQFRLTTDMIFRY